MSRQTKSVLVRLLTPLAGRLPLRLVFSLPFIVQFVLATLLIGILFFRGGQETANSLLVQMRLEVLERVHDKLDKHMSEPLRLNRLNADAWRVGMLDFANEQERDRYFVNNISAFPDIAMTFVGLADGSFYGARRKESGEIQVLHNNRETNGSSWYFSISDKGDALERKEVFHNFDPRTRPWYEVARGGPAFSAVYRHFVFLEPTITAAHPIYNEKGQLVGVFGVDYLLSWLGKMLQEIPLGQSGQIFIIDNEGLLVATSALKSPFELQDGQMKRIRATESANEVLRAAAYVLPAVDQIESQELQLDGRVYFVDIRPFEVSGTRWNIYVVLAADDYLGGLYNVAGNTAVLIGSIVIATFILALWSSGWVTIPILRLNTAARELMSGRFVAVPDDQRRDELGQLNRTFNLMGEKMTDLVANLEDRVEERTLDLAAKTLQEQALRQLYQAELTKAGQVQRTLAPADMDNAKLKVQVVYEPYMLVSGDMCGYNWQNGSLLFGYIVDVAGHGVAVALQTAAMNVMLQEIAHLSEPLDIRLVELNRRVSAYFSDDTLVAAICFEVDFDKRVLRYSAAGITEFFADSCALQGRQTTPGSLLGVSNEPYFEVHTIPICLGDKFCFYSDGLGDSLAKDQELPVGLTFAELVEQVKAIGTDGVRRDDLTALCIEIVEDEYYQFVSYYIDR